MQTALNQRQRYTLCCPELPLSIYREVAAHLRQVMGVEVGIIPQSPGGSFSYRQSQVAGLWIEFPAEANLAIRQRVDQILAYYSDRYRPWQEL